VTTSAHLRVAVAALTALMVLSGCIDGRSHEAHGNHPQYAADERSTEVARRNPYLTPGRHIERTGEVARPSMSGTGSFTLRCVWSHHAAVDPVVSPGDPATPHLHTMFGNTTTAHDSTDASLAAADTTSCAGGTANRSAYWFPALLDESGTVLEPSAITAYYSTGRIATADVEPLPAGLRIIAGNDHRSAASSYVRFTCAMPDGRTAEDRVIPRNCPAGAELQLSVIFPQCWDGRLDTHDHRAHLVYAAAGRCPDTHQQALSEVRIDVRWDLTAGTGGLRLSSDGEGLPGASAHADLIAAWDPEVLDRIVHNCLNRRLDCVAGQLGDGTALASYGLTQP